MAYTPSLYNPYGSQQFQPTMYTSSYQPTYVPQQPVNGLIKVKGIEGAQMYQLPPANGGSMSSGRSGYGIVQSERQGYGYMGRMGHDYIIEELGNEYQRMSPDEKMMMKTKILEKMR